MSRRRAGQGLGYLAEDAAERAVYVVSVAAELAGMHPQTLRQYDRLGLVSPARTRGRGRRYSHRDVERLRRIQTLSQEGINLEGIRRILDLETDGFAYHSSYSAWMRDRQRDQALLARGLLPLRLTYDDVMAGRTVSLVEAALAGFGR